jgi:hypothetical protein
LLSSSIHDERLARREEICDYVHELTGSRHGLAVGRAIDIHAIHPRDVLAWMHSA